MKIAAIIVAGGSGLRMGGERPKQFQLLAGEPVLMHTLRQFACYNIVLALPESHIDYWHQLCREYRFDLPHTVTAGGKERFYSVREALRLVPEDTDMVLVHDGVRPFADKDLIARVIAAAEQTGAAVPGVKPTDTVRYVGESICPVTFTRDDLRLVQTPQAFRYDIITEAYRHDYEPGFTDDATVVEMTLGLKPKVTPGSRENIKLTTPVDFAMARLILEGHTNNKG